MGVEIRRLQLSDERAFRLAHAAFQDPHFQFAQAFDPTAPFQDYLQLLADREDRSKIPSDRVPSTFVCAFMDDQIVGRASIRHGLSEYIKEVGGHIGYGVVPQFRNRGFSKEILKYSLTFCREIGLNEVLVTCDDDNVPSRKTIEGCGGVFERFCVDTGDGVKKRRYWIKTSEGC